MDSVPILLACPASQITSKPSAVTSAERIIEFYEEAGVDYEHWSKGSNMHLGFYGWGMNPFNREAMLERLNLEISTRLSLRKESPSFLVDLGCGMGAVARSIVRKYRFATIKGVTLSPSQVRIASRLNAEGGMAKQIDILECDYTDLPFRGGSADGVFAVESACYANGSDKHDLVREMARVLKPGGRFVVSDCFVRGPERPFSGPMKYVYESACRNWAVAKMPTLEHFVAALDDHGFRDVVVEDISWRAAPSLLHAPFAVLTFVGKKLMARERLKKQSINNLKASLLSLILGMNRSKICYCLISGARA